VALPTDPTVLSAGLTTKILEQVRVALHGRYVVERVLTEAARAGLGRLGAEPRP
jgi:hypothetical protein